MKITVELPDYDGDAVDVIWEEGARISIHTDESSVTVRANAGGLLSLGRQMLYLARNDLPDGAHIHYDDFFTGQQLPYELIIEKADL